MRKYLSNLLGWKTNRKIIVFESDDWGSFRFKDTEARNKFIPEKDKNKCWMSYNDVFESAEDLKQLFDVLSSVKDKNGCSAKFTFLMNPANPDFEKIKKNDFKKFYYETFLETLEKRPDGQNILDLYLKSIASGIVEIGFHGREHLNVKAWMSDLQNKDEIAMVGFNHSMWGFSKNYMPELKRGYRSTYDMGHIQEIDELKDNIEDGIGIINRAFNQNTSYFLPPNGPYHLRLNKVLVKNGIKYIGLSKLHRNPTENAWFQKHLFWIGKKTNTGLTVITRNVIFEPNSPKHESWVKPALKEVKKAFESKKPAVISSHRANYVGGLNTSNREEGLRQLKDFLNEVVQEFPETEFMTSTQLGNVIRKE